MSGAFDPYHKWLGIPPDEQPPNHYRLLGVTLYEADPDVIESAAEGRMALLRSRQSGPNSADSQRLLNEVSGAQRCLLDQATRIAYDGQLRSRLSARSGTDPSPGAQLTDSPGPLYTGSPQAGALTSGPLPTNPLQQALPQTAPPQTVPPASNSPRPLSGAPSSTVAGASQAIPLQADLPGGQPTHAVPSLKHVSRKKKNPAAWLLSPVFIGIAVSGILFFAAAYWLMQRDGVDAGDGVTAREEQLENDGSNEEQGDTDNDKRDGASDETEGSGSKGSDSETNSTDGGDGRSGTNTDGADGSANSDLPTTAKAITKSPWLVLEGTNVSTTLDDAIERESDGSYFVTIEKAGVRTYSFEVLAPDDVRWLRLETIPDDRLPASGPGWNRDGNFILSQVRVSTLPAGQNQWRPIGLERPTASFAQEGMPITDTFNTGRQSGWGIFPELAKPHQAIFALSSTVPKGIPLRIELLFHHQSRDGCTAHIGRFRLSASAETDRPPLVVSETTNGSNSGETSSGASDNAKSGSANGLEAVPGATELAAARALVRQAVPPPAGLAPEDLLAWHRLLMNADRSAEDVAEKYALFSEALKAAELAADARVAFRTIDLMAKNFQTSVVDERVKVLRNIASKAKSDVELDSLLAAAKGVAFDLLAASRFSDCAELLDDTYACFQAADSDLHEKSIGELRKYVRRVVRAEELMQRALETLKKDPADAAAHSTLGAWQAIYQRDLKAGLDHYAKSSDAQWKKLAATESGPTGDAIAVGDQWWDIGLRKDKETKSVMLGRAGYWYERALPSADVKTKEKLGKRLASIRILPDYDPSRRSGTDVVLRRTVNLLALSDPSLDALSARWRRSYESLQADPPETDARLRLPIDVQGGYALQVDFTAIDGRSVFLALPAAGRGFQVVLGVNPASQVAGIQTIAGYAVPKSRVAAPLRIKRGSRHSLVVRFEHSIGHGRITVHLDKNHYFSWHGDLTALDDPLMKRGSASGIAIGSMDGNRVVFHSAEIQLLSGSGQVLRAGDPFRQDK